jgi:hypothetical protein
VLRLPRRPVAGARRERRNLRKVADELTGSPLADVVVSAYDSNDNPVYAVCTSASRPYGMGLVPGTYRIGFAVSGNLAVSTGCQVTPRSLNNAPQYYKGRTSLAAADPVTVTSGSEGEEHRRDAVCVDHGAVTDSLTGAPVQNVEVEVFDANNEHAAKVCSLADWTYRIVGLSTGSYRVAFGLTLCGSHGICAP